MRYFIEIAYNGKNYHGWQIQPDAVSIQEVLEDAMSTVFRNKIKVMGAGRTDTGVHARQLFAHFDINEIKNVIDCVFRINCLLPKDISVKKIISVPKDAHARFDAVERAYEYLVTTVKDPFQFDFMCLIHKKLDVDSMNEAAKILLEYTDFQCFSRNKTGVKTYHCDIKEAAWSVRGNELVFTIVADRFLRNMVRAIVGTLLEIGLGKITKDDFHTIIQSKDRSKAKTSAPAHGLYLTKVTYPDRIIQNTIKTL
ncbi:MAG: tRNA pseudouridine(38-40) synthase TruA [Flavobacteriaceae bacterium]|nr:tRNA pseudouridine(38-40) synthase TruA [Flavobacteriaceae bacterium]